MKLSYLSLQVVASMDFPEVTKYRGLVSAQAHREEIIQDLYTTSQDPVRGIVHGGMIRLLCLLFHYILSVLVIRALILNSPFARDHLMAFYQNTRLKPHRIIFYRLVHCSLHFLTIVVML